MATGAVVALDMVGPHGNYRPHNSDYSILNLEKRKATLDNNVRFFVSDIQQKTGRDVGQIMSSDAVQTNEGMAAEMASLERLKQDDAGLPKQALPLKQTQQIKQAGAPAPGVNMKYQPDSDFF
jgi:hypothetical protein